MLGETIVTALGVDIVSVCSLYPKPLVQTARVESSPNPFAKTARKVLKAGNGFDSLRISNSVMQNTERGTSRNAHKEQEICNQQT